MWRVVEFVPVMLGISAVNLRHMQSLYSVHIATDFLAQAVRDLVARLPAEFKGRLPTARQLANAVRGLLPGRH